MRFLTIIIISFSIFYISCNNRKIENENQNLKNEIEILKLRDSITKLKNNPTNNQTILTEVRQTGSNSKQLEKINELDYIKGYKNKFPSDIKLFENGILKDRIIKLIGEKNFSMFIKYSDVQPPIEILNDERLFLNCGAAHSFTIYESALDINFKLNEITVGILDNDKVLIFRENEHTNLSSEFYSWYGKAKKYAISNK